MTACVGNGLLNSLESMLGLAIHPTHTLLASASSVSPEAPTHRLQTRESRIDQSSLDTAPLSHHVISSSSNIAPSSQSIMPVSVAEPPQSTEPNTPTNTMHPAESNVSTKSVLSIGLTQPTESPQPSEEEHGDQNTENHSTAEASTDRASDSPTTSAGAATTMQSSMHESDDSGPSLPESDDRKPETAQTQVQISRSRPVLKAPQPYVPLNSGSSRAKPIHAACCAVLLSIFQVLAAYMM
ncbi:hypothetical protein IWW50_002913 [Coemansia erecta]|nr:hypothetical protein IWW50_002913 [Coemansia erecta]